MAVTLTETGTLRTTPVAHEHDDGEVASWQPVASRATLNPHFTDPNTGAVTRNAIPQVAYRFGRSLCRVLTSGVRQVRLEWRNAYCQVADPGELDGPNPVRIRAAIEYPAGAWRMVGGSTAWSASTGYAAGDQVLHDGARWVAAVGTVAGEAPSGSSAVWLRVHLLPVHWPSESDSRGVTVAPGDTATSEAVSLPVALLSGQQIAVCLAATPDTAGGRIISGSNSLRGDLAYDTATEPEPGSADDLVDAPLTTQTSLPTGTPIPTPMVLSGRSPDRHTVAALGDSLFHGLYDVDIDGDAGGFVPRALRSTQLFRMNVSGARADALTLGAQETSWRSELLRRYDTVLTDLGGNDAAFGDGTTNIASNVAMVKARMGALWWWLARRCPHVWATTLTPWTSSSDGWAGTANQTRANQVIGGTNGLDGVWGQMRDWLRDGAPLSMYGRSVRAGDGEHPLAGIIDATHPVIDPASGWKWRPWMTTDGMHPNETGHKLMASALTRYLPALARGGRLEDLPAGSFGGEWQSGTGVVQSLRNTSTPVTCLTTTVDEGRGCSFVPATGVFTALVDGEWSFEASAQWTGNDTSVRWLFLAPPSYNPANPVKRYGAVGNNGAIEVLSSCPTINLVAGQQMCVWISTRRSDGDSSLWGTGGSTYLRAMWRGRRRTQT